MPSRLRLFRVLGFDGLEYRVGFICGLGFISGFRLSQGSQDAGMYTVGRFIKTDPSPKELRGLEFTMIAGLLLGGGNEGFGFRV